MQILSTGNYHTIYIIKIDKITDVLLANASTHLLQPLEGCALN